MKDKTSSMDLGTINIKSRIYTIDNTKSYHQSLTPEEYENILNFYMENIYINHKFWDSKILSLSKEQFSELAKIEYERIESRCKFIDPYIKKEKSDAQILEIGCGCGSFLFYLHKMGFSNIRGLDIALLSKPLSKKLWNFSFKIDICEAVYYLKFLQKNMFYDLIFAFDFIEHVSNPVCLLELISLNLKPNGKLFVEIPIIPKGVGTLSLKAYEFFYPEHHIHLYTKEGINKMMESLGFIPCYEKLVRNNNKLLCMYVKADE